MNPTRALWILITGSALLRLLCAMTLGLGNDEAYHFLYAAHPALSYFDHPPMVAWVEMAGLALPGAGTSAWALRLGFILLFAGSTAILARLTSRSYGGAGFLAAFALNVTGYYGLAASMFALPDGPLLFFWLLTLDRLNVALEEPDPRRLRPWAEVGLAWGGAMLSKYHAIFLPMGAALYVLIDGRMRRRWLLRLGPYLAMAIGLLVFSPVLIWNAGHGWVSFLFQGSRAVGGWVPRPDSLLEAILAQAGYLFPWIWVPLVMVLVQVVRKGTAGGSVEAVNVVTADEVLGVSTGEPGQRFVLSGTPFTEENPDGTQLAVLTVTVVDQEGTALPWTQVATFADVDDYDSCFLWDAVAHQVVFGPRTPYAAGRSQHGAVPVRGARVHARYETSQGSLGNIPAGTLVAWERSGAIAVTNLQPTAGGVDAESVPEAVARTNAVLVPLDRAVTADDYAQVLTRRVAGIARVHTSAVPGQEGSDDPGYLQVTAVPTPMGRPGEPLPDSDLRLSDASAAAAGQRAESVRLLCARVQIADPAWIPFSVTATVYSWAGGDSLAGQAGQQSAQAALFRYFHPTLGGPSGTGWPFGRPVHVGDAYEVLAGLPETITVTDVGIANQAGIPTSWIDVPEHGLPLLSQAEVVLVASGTEQVERVPPGLWGLFDGANGRGKLLGTFPGDATDLENGVGTSAKSLVNVTSQTIEVFSLRRTKSAQAGPPLRQVAYPGTVVNLGGVVSSAIVHLEVPEGTFCLYEHPALAGKQWLFWPGDSPIDLALPRIGAALTVSSALNRTAGTVQLRGDTASADTEQLVRPGEAADLSSALDDQARFVTLLNGPGEGQFGLTAGAGQWVFNRSVADLPAVLGPGLTVSSAANQTPYQVTLYPQPGFMTGAAGLQSVAPRSTAQVRDELAGEVASAAIGPLGSVTAWGDPASGLTDLPAGLTDVRAVASGAGHCLALRADGTVTAWGDDSDGQSSAPPDLTNVVAVAAGTSHSLALTADGTVTAWGADSDGQTAVPAGLSDVAAIAAGGGHSLALTADGTVTAWGDQTGKGGANRVPAGLTDVVAVATSTGHSLAVKADGTVTAWGANRYGETVVPDGLGTVIAVAAGTGFSLALHADGTVTGWGDQTGDGGANQVLAGLTGVVAIAAATRSLALGADGTIVAWGTDAGSGQPFAVPASTAARSVAVGVGEACSLAICVTQ